MAEARVDSRNLRWLAWAVLIGALYLLVALWTAEMANAAASIPVRNLWRYSAFIVSGVVFLAHIALEHFRFGNPARATAWHTAVAAALGGFGLALAANMHELSTAADFRPRMLIALVAWPLLTGVPAFVAAIAVAAVLGRWRKV